MKTGFILLHIVLLLATSGEVFCQSECICPGEGISGTEPYLAGELYTPEVQPDLMTWFNINWLPGDIYLAGGGIIKNIQIRYNGLVDELFCLDRRTNQIIKLDKGAVNQFHFHDLQGDTSVYFRKINVNRNLLNDSIEIFGQEIYHGVLSLFVLHSFYLDRKEAVQIDKRLILKDIYKEVPVYYLKYLSNKTVELKRFNRKSIFALAPDKEPQIRKFFRENISGNFKTNQEIISLMEFLNSIIDQ